jgi:hypothetical protein
MDRKKLAVAVAEAERFIARAKALPAPVERQYYHGGGSYVDDGFPPKDGGAIRRASMDLTRSLADLRRPA